MVNGEFFRDKTFVLFLNKKDLFKKKVETLDLRKAFPDYKGGADYTKAVEFIRGQFISKYVTPRRIVCLPIEGSPSNCTVVRIKNRPASEVYIHVTCAIDTSNVKFVFDAVSETIFTQRLHVSGTHALTPPLLHGLWLTFATVLV
jgi:hypothetical protein